MKAEERSMHLPKVIREVQLLLPRGGVQRYTIPRLKGIRKEAIGGVTRARQMLKRGAHIVKVQGHEAVGSGGRFGGFIRGRRKGFGGICGRFLPREVHNGLQSAAIVKLKVFLAEAVNRGPLRVSHHDADQNLVGFRFQREGGCNFAGGNLWWRALLRF
jgi:hypothetical protein